MTTVLVFLLIVSSVSIWWLSKQRLTSKPWLQSGLEIFDGHADQIRSSKPKVGLIVFLGIIGMFFYITRVTIVPRALGPANFGNFTFLERFFSSIINFFDFSSSTAFFNFN